MPRVILACHAMATRFELVLHGPDSVSLRAAGEEAVEEIERLEGRLSCFRASSEISRLNAQAAQGPVPVDPELFSLLAHAQRLWRETDGAFDPTIGPLMGCWGFAQGGGALPAGAVLAAARARCGMESVELDARRLTVRFWREGMRLDLGAIGKGHAVERAADLLREAGVTSAFLHGGTSTVGAIGAPPDAATWKVALERPGDWRVRTTGVVPLPADHTDIAEQFLAVIPLKDESLSVSAVWGKCFEADGRTYGHVLDPRLGRPAQGAWLTAVALPSATESDALSTALLVVGVAGHDRIASLRPDMRTLVVGSSRQAGQLHVAARGIVASAV